MTISARAPRGKSPRCPVCNAALWVEADGRVGEKDCPRCGQTLWYLALPDGVLMYEKQTIGLEVRQHIESLVSKADSLDLVELVMEWEEKWQIAIGDPKAAEFQSLADFIDYHIRNGFD
jgi:acyl carrier protein